MNQNTLTVLTYNIHKGFSTGNRYLVIHQIREALISADADVMFLQETQGRHAHHEKMISDWPVLSQPEFIAEGVWPYCAYGSNVIHARGDHGNAILSKYPIISWENINVSPFHWASRSVLHAVIRIPDHPVDVHILCIHFGLSGGERRSQIARLCERINSHVPADAALIVAGDFNDWLGRAERQFHQHLHLREIFQVTHGKHARSFPAWLPFLQMDRIYFRGLLPVSCNRLSLTPWHSFSDHAPLAATFNFQSS